MSDTRNISFTTRVFPSPLLNFTLVLTVMVLGWSEVQFFRSYKTLQTMLVDDTSIIALKGDIMRLDEVLTMSARMASVTGDMQWQERYFTNEPQLAKAIDTIINLAPDGTLKPLAEKTNDANTKLVVMEHQALALAQQNHLTEAQAILSSPDYQAQKKRYSDGMEAYITHLSKARDDRISHFRDDAYRALVILVIFMFFLFFTWMLTVKSIYTWRNTVEESRRTLESTNTQLRKALKQIDAKNAELELFTQMASHDLQEPLRTMSSFLQLFENSSAHSWNTEEESYIRHIQEAVIRMRALVQDILVYSGMSKQPDTFQELDCSLILQQVIAQLKGSIAESAIDIHIPPLPRIWGISAQLAQVFQNLISNAIRYRAAGRQAKLDINVELQGDNWCFSFKDNGIGIDAEHIQAIFTPFVRLHNHRDFPGTGIGLAICKWIVENHEGRIWAESTPGEGSCFYFTIPVKPVG